MSEPAADTDAPAAVEGERRRRTVTLDGQQVTVRPVCVADLPDFLRRGEALFSAVFAEDAAEQQSVQSVLELAAARVPDLTSWIALGAGLEEARVNRLPADDALDLALAVVEVNLDFFGQRAAPLLNAAVGRLARIVSAAFAGMSTTPAAGSSQPDTAAPTSPGTH
jgi:hypothetical protein